MRSEGSVRQKLKQAKFRHLKRVLEERLKRRPCNCTHNRSLQYGPLAKFGFCSLHIEDPAEWQALLCTELREEMNNAPDCPAFEPPLSKDELKQEFIDKFGLSDLGTVAADYPDLAALMWVLEDEGDWDLPDPEIEPHVETLPEDVEDSAGRVGFWKRGRRALHSNGEDLDG